jgi:hypothetical protein
VTTDFEHPLSKRALEALAGKGTETMLLEHAIELTSEARGRDVLHQALLVVCDPGVQNHGKPWDQGRGAFHPPHCPEGMAIRHGTRTSTVFE